MISKMCGSRLLVLLSLLYLTGCSQQRTPAPEPADIRCRVDGALAPEWVCSTEQFTDEVTAIGSAPLSKLGLEFSRHEALSAARADLARQTRSLLLEQIEKPDGVDSVSDDVAKKVIKDARQLKTWQNGNTQDVYVLIGISKTVLTAKVQAAIDKL